MGCEASKETQDARPLESNGNQKKGGGGGGGRPESSTDHNKPKNSSLNPSVALQNLLLRPNLADLGRTGKTQLQEGAHHLRNIFAVPLEAAVNFKTYKSPVYAKKEEEKDFIMDALRKNFVFESMHHKELFHLMQAFEEISVSEGDEIIKEGDKGDYFYVIHKGHCTYHVGGQEVGKAESGDSFGELALLYTCPRAATVKAATDAILFRVDQITFRYILQERTKEGQERKLELLKTIPFLKDVTKEDMAKLVGVMTPKPFKEGEYLMHKGDAADNFFIIQEGSLAVTHIGDGDVHYEDMMLKAGDYCGESAVLSSQKRMADAIAKTDGMAFTINKETFKTTLGDISAVVFRSLDKKKLTGIKVIADSKFDQNSLNLLSNLIVDRTYKAGETILKEGSWAEAELFLMRQGKVHLTTKSGDRDETFGSGGYFGDDLLLADAAAGKNGPKDPSTALPEYTVTVLEDCSCGVLSLRECRKVIDTVYIGKSRKVVYDSLIEKGVPLKDLKRHSILGAGTFGQVWLVSREASDGSRRPYALKVQSKYELCQAGQAKAVVHEKQIMAQLQHPFISRLVASYKDNDFVYMLMGLVQGGELYSVIHTSRRDGMKEKHAVFYMAGISEGLSYMHRRGFVYRDLKPENVLIDNLGFPVLVDFGFAKYVTEKTYTLCGTPLYLAPEVILNRGHNWAADHWSFGVLSFEIIHGYTPFYKDGMDQMELFRAVVKCKYSIPAGTSPAAESLLRGFIVKDPAQRLGSLAGGEDDILKHPFFESIDIEQFLSQEAKAPYVPSVKDPLDSSNFEDWSHLDDKTKKKFPKLTPEQEKIFYSF